MIKKILLTALMTFSVNTYAVPLTYEGELTNGSLESGFVSDPFNTGSDFWYFEGSAGDIIDIVVGRLTSSLDPALNLYMGLHSDTDTLGAVIASADDEIAHSGPFGDPHLSYQLLNTGSYTVAIWDFISDSTNGGSYEIELNGASASVPEPATLALMGLGLAGFGFRRGKKQA